MKKFVVRALIVVVVLIMPTPTNATSATSATFTNLPSSTDTSLPSVYELENEPSECIGFLPKPGCGKQPDDAGERGGALQYLVFAIMIVGLFIVGLGILRGVKKQRPTNK